MYTPSPDIYNTVTTGIVMDTSDPQGKGRVRIYCADYGDLPGTSVENLPWCRYLSPFGGMVTSDNMTRGPKDSKSSGSIAYGMWALPKVGAVAAVMCLNGDPSRRMFIGCLTPDNAEHTMPHGRYLDDSSGPLTSTEQPIEPLHSNMKKAFGSGKHEMQTRGADSSVTGLTQDSIDRGLTTSKKKDSNTGFKQSRLHPDKKTESTGMAFDSQIYSLTTPGFHSISMDDSADNGRIRIRTTCGHSIIMDDTNERIYINTAEGNNWIEIDQDGTIDIYAAKSVSINSDTDINFHAKKSIRLDSENIYLNATKNLNATAAKNMDLTADIMNSNGKSKYGVKTKTCDIKSKSLSTTANSTSITSGMSLNLSGLATSITGGVSLATTAPMVLATTPTRLFDPMGPLGAVTSLAKTGAAIGSAAGTMTGVVNSIMKAPQEALSQVMSAMPSDKLGEALNSMDFGDLQNVMSAIPTDELSSVLNNIPMPDLKGMLDKLPGDAAGNILNSMNNDDVFDMFTNMPSFEVGKLLDKLPGESVGNLIKTMNAEGVGNPLSIISSDKVGNILNSIPERLITPTLESLPKNVLTNLNIGDIGSLIQKTSDTEAITSFLPNDLLGLSLGSSSNEQASNILSKMTDEQLEHVIPHVPTSKIPSGERFQSIVDKQPLIDMREIIGNMPTHAQPLFHSQQMTRADVGHTFRTMPSTTLSDVFRTMQPRHTNLLFQLMHGADIGHIMSNIVNPNSVIGMLESGVLFDVMGRMPGANIAKMFEGIAHGDIHSIFQLLGCGGIGNMLNNMPGGDIIGTLGMYSSVLSGLPDMIANGFANFPDVAGMLAHALGDIPNVQQIVDDIMSQIPDVGGMLATLQGMLMALPVTLSMPALELPSLTSLLDLGGDMVTQMTGVLSDGVANAFSGIANAATGAAANVAAAVGGVAAEAGAIAGGAANTAGMLSSMASTLPSIGMMGAMGGLLGAATGMAGKTLDLNNIGKMAGSLASGQLNGMNGVGRMMGCMNGYSTGHIMSNAHPGDLGNLLYAIPNDMMSGVLSKMPTDMLGGLVNSMNSHDLGTMFGKMSGNEITGVLDLMNPDSAMSMLTKMQGPRLATPGDPTAASYITRLPGHEPWGRSYSAGDYDRSPMYSYDHPDIGKNGGKRNKYWRR